jgi:ribosomal protein S25
VLFAPSTRGALLSTRRQSKLREKKNNRVAFTQGLFDTCMTSAHKKARAMTLYTLIENYKIGGSLARKLVRELLKSGSIKCVSSAVIMRNYLIPPIVYYYYYLCKRVTPRSVLFAPSDGLFGQ